MHGGTTAAFSMLTKLLGDRRQSEPWWLIAPGLAVAFMLREELTPHVSFEDLIVVQFKGRCEMDNFPILFDERGPNALAFTHSSEGEILPFS